MMKERRLVRIEIDESCPLDKFDVVRRVHQALDGSSYVDFKNVTLETMTKGSITMGSFSRNDNIVMVLSCEKFKEVHPAQEIPMLDVELTVEMVKNGKTIRYGINFPNIDDVLDTPQLNTVSTIGSGASISAGYIGNTQTLTNKTIDFGEFLKDWKDDQKDTTTTSCTHEWKTVRGLSKDYTNCTKCDMKKEDYDEQQVAPEIPEFTDSIDAICFNPALAGIHLEPNGKMILASTPRRYGKSKAAKFSMVQRLIENNDNIDADESIKLFNMESDDIIKYADEHQYMWGF